MDFDDPKSRQKVLDELSDYQTKGDILDQLDDIEKALKTESHRGLVIILVSYVEDALLDSIIGSFPSGEDHRRALARGPLRSVENRIAAAKALGVITEREAIVIDVFKAMRNACAHSRLDISFATPELANALALILAPDGREMIHESEPDARMGSFITCVTYMLRLFKGRTHFETFTRMGELIEELGSEGHVRSSDLMLAALREIRTGSPSPDSAQKL